MEKKKDDRKQLKIRYRMLENGEVRFIDPCVDDMPAELFLKIIGAINNIEREWNTSKKDRYEKRD